MTFKYSAEVQCEGKHAFANRAQAESTMKKKGGDMVSYKCVYCQHWHVGHALRKGTK
jgi:aspartate carbamoyltransferase regulatory subunit